MGKVLIFGNEDDPEYAETAAALERFGVYAESARGNDISEADIVVFVNPGAKLPPPELPRECIGIAADDDLPSLNVLKRSGSRAVTCGFSASCAVTISGLDGDRAAVGIQRDLVSAGGGIIEAREIPVSVGGINSPFAIMAAVAAALCSDSENRGFYEKTPKKS